MLPVASTLVSHPLICKFPSGWQHQSRTFKTRGEDACLACETGAALRVVGELPREDLDRHVTTELAVVRAVYLAHPGRAECGADLVRAEQVTASVLSKGDCRQRGGRRQFERPGVAESWPRVKPVSNVETGGRPAWTA
jgi:hypothetical protein